MREGLEEMERVERWKGGGGEWGIKRREDGREIAAVRQSTRQATNWVNSRRYASIHVGWLATVMQTVQTI